MRMTEAHFPDRVPIDAYGNGGFRFADMSHRGNIIVVPSGVYAWAPADPAALSSADFERVFRETDVPELMLVGTGTDIVPLSQTVRQAFRDASIGVDTMTTGAAARTYNILLSEGRSAGVALIAV